MANGAKQAKYGLGDIPINLSQAFQVHATDGVGGYFVQGQPWHIVVGLDPGTWDVDFSDHNSGTTANSVYSITIQLNSTDPADSVYIRGYIRYREPK
jgi:hypothetical protein